MAKLFYGVTVVRSANVYVEASSPEEAMSIADNYADKLAYERGIEEQFECSDVRSDCSDNYSSLMDDLSDTDIVLTKEGEVGPAGDFSWREEDC